MMNSNHQSLTQRLKRAVVGIIGLKLANRITAPYHDRRARQRTQEFLAHLPANDLYLNLGCGYRPMKGWVNVDRARGPEVQVVWDLVAGLPFPESSCSLVFSEHFIEHISKEDAARFLSECYRVLKTSGILRISTPDAELFLRSYAGDRKFLAHASFSQPVDTPVDRVNYMMREYGQHLWSYDEELLTLMLKRAGFGKVIRQHFGVSVDPRLENIDFAEREFESIYLEAIK